MPSRTPRPPSFPKEILSEEFVRQHQLVFRLHVGPLMTLTPPHDWAPMTDDEWFFLLRLLPPGHDQGLAGRPVSGDIWATPTTPDPARARLDQIFRAVMLKRRNRRPDLTLRNALLMMPCAVAACGGGDVGDRGGGG